MIAATAAEQVRWRFRTSVSVYRSRHCQQWHVGTVELGRPQRRTHAFAVFYTGGSVAGATGPLLSGLLGDVVGLPIALAAVSCLALITVPMVWALRPAFRSG